MHGCRNNAGGRLVGEAGVPQNNRILRRKFNGVESVRIGVRRALAVQLGDTDQFQPPVLVVENEAGNRHSTLCQKERGTESNKKENEYGCFFGHPNDGYNRRKSTEI